MSNSFGIMKAIRKELYVYGKDITIDNSSAEARKESLGRFEEFTLLCGRISELSRPIK